MGLNYINLWAATDLRALGFMPLRPDRSREDLWRRLAAKPRTRRRYFDDKRVARAAGRLPEPELARELLAFVQTGEDPTRRILWSRAARRGTRAATASGGVAHRQSGDDAFAKR